MRWGRVEIEVVLLDVLAVVTLAIGEAKEAFFDDRISSIPKCQREAQTLLLVGEASQTVLAPMVGARTRLIMAEVAPRVAIVAVVLAHGPPLALRQIGTPLLPRNFLLPCLLQSPLFRCLIQLLHAAARLHLVLSAVPSSGCQLQHFGEVRRPPDQRRETCTALGVPAWADWGDSAGIATGPWHGRKSLG